MSAATGRWAASVLARGAVYLMVFAGVAACTKAARSPVDSTARDCGSGSLEPPVLAVVDAVTGAPICDPTVLVPDPADAGAPADAIPTLCRAPTQGCPAPLADAVPGQCRYALQYMLEWAPHSYAVDVSKPGFVSARIRVTSGVSGCIAEQPASQTTVMLTPIADDAGTDAN